MPGGDGGGRADSGGAGTSTHEEVVFYTDGASKGNPGPAGAGGVILTRLRRNHRGVPRAPGQDDEQRGRVRSGPDRAREGPGHGRAPRHGASRQRTGGEPAPRELQGQGHRSFSTGIWRLSSCFRGSTRSHSRRYRGKRTSRADRLAQTGAPHGALTCRRAASRGTVPRAAGGRSRADGVGQAAADGPRASRSRKVRAPQGRVLGNPQWERS